MAQLPRRHPCAAAHRGVGGGRWCRAVQVGEGLLEIAGLLAMLFNCLSLKDYVVVKRAQRRAQQQAGATESKGDASKDD